MKLNKTETKMLELAKKQKRVHVEVIEGRGRRDLKAVKSLIEKGLLELINSGAESMLVDRLGPFGRKEGSYRVSSSFITARLKQ